MRGIVLPEWTRQEPVLGNGLGRREERWDAVFLAELDHDSGVEPVEFSTQACRCHSEMNLVSEIPARILGYVPIVANRGR